MTTSNTRGATTATLEGYEEKIKAQMKDAKARLDQFEARAKEQSAHAEITAITGLKAAKQNIDRKLEDLKTTNETHVARAKASIDEDVATFKASVDDFTTRFRAR
jgi:hypothetical protein